MEWKYADGKLHGKYEIKGVNGHIEKGQMENNKRHGTWEFYIPAYKMIKIGYWYKQDYANG